MSVDIRAASFKERIIASVAAHLSNPQDLNVSGFVDQLFVVAADGVAVGCELVGDGKLRFFAEHDLAAREEVIVSVDAARAVLRMICARLGVLCQERTGKNVSLYGDQAVIRFDLPGRPFNCSVAFTNTPDRQTFTIKPLKGC